MVTDVSARSGDSCCPRCQALFLCCKDTIESCHCGQVRLTDAQKVFIAANWDGCLCHQCLLDVITLTRSEPMPD